ncbi:18426_t:CDS:2 [Dentiscutata erythropus]|uniref:18426_t:CDS:1 n=1 Tax=Dentiscutata erythropus TaxID=1348616 RepID=A0A9N9HQG3_9GLOM|nr:18426_t:CDS:2 [Dentiscutata erythropus]
MSSERNETIETEPQIKAYIDNAYQKTILTIVDKQLEQINWANTEEQPGIHLHTDENQVNITSPATMSPATNARDNLHQESVK